MPNYPENISILEFIDAIEKNGFPQITGALFSLDRFGKVNACAAGQAVLNLGVVAVDEVTEDSVDQLNEDITQWISDNLGYHFYSEIYIRNDRSHMTCEEIAQELREVYAGS